MAVGAKYADLLLDRRSDGTVVVTFNRPAKLNALSHNLRLELINVFEELGKDRATRAVVLTGGPNVFAAGQDLSESQHFKTDEVKDWVAEWMRLYHAIGKSPKPTVAAMSGYAVGAAFQIALLCDVRICSDTARLGMLEVDDAIPCITGTRLLYEYLGRGRAAELVLTTRFVEAPEALAWGLVSKVVPRDRLLEEAADLARRLGAKPETGMRKTREWLWTLLMRDWDLTEDFVTKAQTAAYATGEAQKAMADFVAKRGQGRSR